MTAATLQALAAETAEATAHVHGVTEQARLRGLTTEAPELTAAKLWQRVVRLRVIRDRARDDLYTARDEHEAAKTNYETAMAEFRAVKRETI